MINDPPYLRAFKSVKYSEIICVLLIGLRCSSLQLVQSHLPAPTSGLMPRKVLCNIYPDIQYGPNCIDHGQPDCGSARHASVRAYGQWEKIGAHPQIHATIAWERYTWTLPSRTFWCVREAPRDSAKNDELATYDRHLAQGCPSRLRHSLSSATILSHIRDC